MPGSEPRQSFILCADDFGFTPGVSRGVLELVRKRRLSAVGCMTTMETFPSFGEELQKHGSHIDIGLHIVLTGLRPLGDMLTLAPIGKLPSIGDLAKLAIMDKLDKTEIKAEVTRQIELFSSVMGRLPDFVDGHHHVQQLPVIRDCILDALTAQHGNRLPYLRVCHEPFWSIIRRGVAPARALMIGLFGSGLSRRARKLGLPVTGGFSGVYDFADHQPYAALFDRFTRGLRRNSLIMCHPGYVDDELRHLDSLTTQREAELAFFLNDEFIELLRRKNLRLGRFEHGPESFS